jgi:hypothetical protein
MGVLEGRPFHQIKERIRTHYWWMLAHNVAFFGPIQLFNLGYSPLWLRPIVMNCGSLLWSIWVANVNVCPLSAADRMVTACEQSKANQESLVKLQDAIDPAHEHHSAVAPVQ